MTMRFHQPAFAKVFLPKVLSSCAIIFKMQRNVAKLVSIIVPAKNEEKNILKCVESLLDINYENKEIIIVNDGSTDRTAKILVSFAEKIKIINTKGIGPSKARNMAIENAKGQYIAFTDADCIVDRNWIDELLKGFISDNVYGVGGSQLSPKDESKFGKYVSSFFEAFGFVSDYIHQGEKINCVDHNPTCNVIYRREIFDLVGKFREDLWPCEDLEFDIRVRDKGYLLTNNPKAIIYHYRPSTFNGFLKMMYRYGKAHSKLNLIHGFCQPIHFLPLVIFILLIFNVMLYKNNTNILYILDITLILIGLFFLLFKVRTKFFKVFYLFLTSVIAWLTGYFEGAGVDFWGSK